MNENQQNANFYDTSKYTIDKAMQFISPRYVLQVSICRLHCFQCTVIDRYMENTRCFDPENMEANEDRTMFEEVSTIRPNFHNLPTNKYSIELSSAFTVLFNYSIYISFDVAKWQTFNYVILFCKKQFIERFLNLHLLNKYKSN